MDSTFYLTLAQGQSATDFLEEHDGDIDDMVDVITDESTRNALDAVESYNNMLRHFFAFECRVEALRHLRALMNDESLTAIQRYHVCRLVMQFSFDEPGPRPARRKTVARDHAANDSPPAAVHSVKKVAEDDARVTNRAGAARHDVRRDEQASIDVDCANEDEPSTPEVQLHQPAREQTNHLSTPVVGGAHSTEGRVLPMKDAAESMTDDDRPP